MATLLHRTSGRWRLGLMLSLITAGLWGVLPVALTVALQKLDVYTLTWFRFLFAFGLLFVYLAARRQLPPLQKLRTLNWKLLIAATVGLAGNYLLYLEGLAHTSPAYAQVLIQLAPVLLGLGALVVFKERYTASQWLGLGIFAFGFVLFFNERLLTLVAAPEGYLAGSALIVIAAASWALYALAQKQLLRTLPSAAVMLLLYGGCAILFVPFATPIHLIGQDLFHGSVLIFCALNTLGAYGAFAEALDHWDASRVSAILTLTPVFTLASVWAVSWLWPTLIPAERIGGVGVAGTLLVILGSLALALGQRRPQPAS